MDSRLIFLHSRRPIHAFVFPRCSPLLARVPERARPICCRSAWRKNLEKRVGFIDWNRTKTDTGRRGEYPQALERTVLKELGKLTP
jgi:hypothetical protein